MNVHELREWWLTALESEGAARATLQTYRAHSDGFLKHLGDGEPSSFSVRAYLPTTGATTHQSACRACSYRFVRGSGSVSATVSCRRQHYADYERQSTLSHRSKSTRKANFKRCLACWKLSVRRSVSETTRFVPCYSTVGCESAKHAT